MAKKPRKTLTRIEWEAIRNRYAMGESIYKIAAAFGVTDSAIRQRKKKEGGWSRDIAAEASRKSQLTLLTGEVTPVIESEKMRTLVEVAASRQVEAGKAHQDAIRRQRESAIELGKRLHRYLYKGDAEALGGVIGKRESVMDYATKAAQMLKSTVQLERQALGMDADETARSFEDVLRDI